jgi:hypothetical protein
MYRSAVEQRETEFYFDVLVLSSRSSLVRTGIVFHFRQWLVHIRMYDSNFNPHGFTYSAGVFHVIDFPGGLFTQVYGINESGVIVGLYGDAANFTPYGYNVLHAFQLSNGIFTTVDAPPFAYESYAYSITIRARWSAGTTTGINPKTTLSLAHQEALRPLPCPLG